jgi:uncharacterized DUF497 family protein
MDDKVSGFDWTRGTGRIAARGVSIAKIEALLRDLPFVAPDLKHVHLEDRLIAVGRTAKGPTTVHPHPREARAEDDPACQRPIHACEGDESL